MTNSDAGSVGELSTGYLRSKDAPKQHCLLKGVIDSERTLRLI
jgi:hypothetical protein